MKRKLRIRTIVLSNQKIDFTSLQLFLKHRTRIRINQNRDIGIFFMKRFQIRKQIKSSKRRTNTDLNGSL